MWHKVSKDSDISEYNPVVVEAGGDKIAVFKSGNHFYAIDNLCAHRGGPLEDGHVEAGKVTCPWHAWRFDLKTGDCDGIPGVKQKCYKVKIENGEVWVEA